jgi:twitching motility protein PilT
MDLDALLLHAVERGASDIHLKLGRPPVLRGDGALKPLADWPDLDEQALDGVLAQVTSIVPRRLAQFHETGELDIAYTASDLPRFRVNGFRQRGATSFAFRVIPQEVPTFDKLGLPKGVARLAAEERGLVLVTGATGSGKTNTLAAMIGEINGSRNQHIVTIEDPIEVVHPDLGCIVNQREVGLDTESFAQALRRVLRQDPDVILIGELRDAETAQTALQAAESGHLVFSTMHTIDSAETVGRLVEFFPPLKQQQVRSILAGVLKGVISQRLLPRVGGGRVPAVEIMVTNARIADLLREGKSEEIEDAIADGEFLDMQTFKQALIALVIDGKVDREIAAAAASNRHDFLVALEQEEKRRRFEAEGGDAAPEPEEAEPASPAPAASFAATGGFKGARRGAAPRPEREENDVPQFALRAPETS